jgi:hypothetical protein
MKLLIYYELLSNTQGSTRSAQDNDEKEQRRPYDGNNEIPLILLLMFLSLFEFSDSRLRVIKGLRHALLNLDQGLFLFVGFHVDIFCNLVDARHYIVYFIQLFLSLSNYLGHVIRLHSDLNTIILVIPKTINTFRYS